ncbi:MAG: NAD-dependent succinate-semialdehyde dehydrogenase [Anaerolineae bacterium]|nr:NAD-dependent succinate-semialdehyde dehydrogenase [Anaerolineae bacterium]MCA9893518.1 NAD-dependent succinate-semialdehyde dehydrogenase [Anaerolineae bacterium]MCB9460686.1 NAD-dependent succinate-semialdehyde dehydrogenase [Anaerolineaceae bacterium]
MTETLLINGNWQASSTGASIPVLNPADGSIIAQMAVASADDVNAAVAAARKAFPIWAELNGRERATIMHEAARLYREKYLDESVRLLTMENGKPLNDSIKECKYTADVIDFYADESRRITGTHFSGDVGPTHSFMLKQPVGVVAAIVPWNFPVDLLAWKIGPGLAAGCTFVIKPSEETPLASALLIQAFLDAGLPPGVLNIVTGAGEVGAMLVQHPDVDKIAFTGSVPTGQWIGEQAGRQLKRVTLELGGSAPFIVCRDANLDLAIPESMRRAFSHTGQICISVNRIFVQRHVYDEFVQRFAERAHALRVAANGLEEPNADMGPMINVKAIEKVQQHVDDARSGGAKVLVGGERLRGEEYNPQGVFYPPTVLADATPQMRVMQEETFGPVAPIAPFDTLDDAIHLANSTPYGLAAYLYTQDLDSAFYASRRLNFGGIGINVNDITDIRGSFGGMKQSGIGRELGEPGLDAYLEHKHIRYRYQAPRQES